MTVAPLSEIQDQNRLSENRSLMATGMPIDRPAITEHCWALQWKSGRQVWSRSSSVKRRWWAKYAPVLVKLRCGSTTPFGRPVVPDV